MQLYTIENDYIKVETFDYAASVYQIYLKVDSEKQKVLSTPKTHELFVSNTLSYGRTIGRTAGRLHKTKETVKYVDFKDSEFLQHGGPNKFSLSTFKVIEHTPHKIVYFIHRDHLEDQYHGDLDVYITYEIEGSSLIVRHEAKTNSESLCNITFHPYFNLNQSTSLNSHTLTVFSKYFLGQNEKGHFNHKVSVIGTYKDYLKPRKLLIDQESKLDDIFLLEQEHALRLETNSYQLDVYTNYPSLVLFTQNKPTMTDLSNALSNSLFTGLAIEGQKPQSELNLLTKDDTYNYYTKYQFSIKRR